ncbi:MAG: response regulator [bacterium]|nr:MAG: response regulator [bacterium]
MRLSCVLCSKEYIFDPAKIPDQGFRISCGTCGTKYTVLLPAGWRSHGSQTGETIHTQEAARAAKVPETPLPGPAADEQYILLADDTEFFRTMMSDLLVSNGYRVKAAADGQEALDIFKAAPDAFLLILLDLQMPRLSGFGVLEQLKEADLPVPPIIVMTGVHDSHEDIQIVREMGASGFLDKSLDPSVAFERIRMVLDQEKQK